MDPISGPCMVGPLLALLVLLPSTACQKKWLAPLFPFNSAKLPQGHGPDPEDI